MGNSFHDNSPSPENWVLHGIPQRELLVHSPMTATALPAGAAVRFE